MFSINPKTVPGDVEKAHRMPRARTLGLIILAGYILFIVSYLLVWENFPDWQLILNRISWSSSDFVGVSAVALGLYSYMLFQKFDRNKDIQYLQELALGFKKAGINPEDMAVLLVTAKSIMKEVDGDKEFRDRLKRVLTRIAKERVEGMAKLTEQELYEVLRSG